MIDGISKHYAVYARRFSLLLLASLLGLLLYGCGDSNESGLTVGQAAPALDLPAAAGGAVSLADYRGNQPVLLYFHMADG